MNTIIEDGKNMTIKAGSKLIWILVLIGGVSLKMENSAQAAAAEENSALGEIVVTARRKEENLQNVPVSVVAFTEEALREKAIRNLEEVGAQSVNVLVNPSSNAGSSAASIYIRGIGQFDELVTTDPGVGVYVDGVYMARTTGALLDIGDFQRVEVLRGPQGTLFGKNTIGGAINITTHQPDKETNGFLEATVGQFSRIDVKGAINLPISAETLSGRISFSSRNASGYAHQANGVDTGNDNSQGVRGQLRWTPNGDTDVVLAADKSRIRERMEPRSLAYVNPAAPIAAGFNLLGSLFPGAFTGATSFGPQYLSSSPYFNFATGENTNDLDSWGVSLNAKLQFSENIGLTSITAYRDQKSRSAIDADTTPANLIQFNEDMQQNQFSEEAQLRGSSLDAKLDWVTGAIYFREKADMVSDSFQVPDLRLFIGDLSVHDLNGIKNDSIGAFAEATYHLTDKLAATVGARFTHEKKEWTHDFRQQFFGGALTVPGTESHSWNPVTPKVGFQYSWTPALMTYASVSRGFRSGGFNGRANSPGDQSFDPEYVRTYEVGVKSQWLSNTIRLNAAAFYNDYRDLQILIVSATANGGFEIFTKNAAKAKTQGVELEIAATPLAGLEISGSVGYLDAKIKESTSPAIAPGNTLQMSPKLSTNVGAQYRIPIGSFGNLSVGLNWAHKSKTYYDNSDSEAIADSFSMLNGRVALISNKKWEVAGFMKNITNRANAVGGFDAAAFGFGMLQYGRPREYGVSARYEF